MIKPSRNRIIAKRDIKNFKRSFWFSYDIEYSNSCIIFTSDYVNKVYTCSDVDPHVYEQLNNVSISVKARVSHKTELFLSLLKARLEVCIFLNKNNIQMRIFYKTELNLEPEP